MTTRETGAMRMTLLAVERVSAETRGPGSPRRRRPIRTLDGPYSTCGQVDRTCVLMIGTGRTREPGPGQTPFGQAGRPRRARCRSCVRGDDDERAIRKFYRE